MRYFITNVLPHHLSGKYKISYAAANFSWALIHSSVFDEVFSIAPLNVSGAIDDVDMPELVTLIGEREEKSFKSSHP